MAIVTSSLVKDGQVYKLYRLDNSSIESYQFIVEKVFDSYARVRCIMMKTIGDTKAHPKIDLGIVFHINLKYLIGETSCEEGFVWELANSNGRFKSDRLGCNCIKCKMHNSYAESNLPDGGYICYNCRS